MYWREFSRIIFYPGISSGSTRSSKWILHRQTQAGIHFPIDTVDVSRYIENAVVYVFLSRFIARVRIIVNHSALYVFPSGSKDFVRYSVYITDM